MNGHSDPMCFSDMELSTWKLPRKYTRSCRITAVEVGDDKSEFYSQRLNGFHKTDLWPFLMIIIRVNS